AGKVRPARHESRGLGARLEVAVLVEHAVVRQVLLVIDAGAAAVVQNGGGVEDVVPLVNESNDDRQSARGLRNRVESAQVGLDECRLEQQVFGRGGRYRQLRERHERATERARPLDAAHDQADVTLEVADCSVDLAQGDAESPHGPLLYLRTGAGHLLSSGLMPAKTPWLPSTLPPGAKPERCPACSRLALI